MTDNLRLVEPALQYKEAHLAAVREFCAAGEWDADPDQIAVNFETILRWIAAQKDPATVDAGQLPSEDFWLMDGEEYIGKLTLRTQINEQFLHVGGHIGYDIRPSKRRQGYGTELLRLGLEKARERGLTRVLLTCDETNIGSRKLIEANRGQLENAVVVEGSPVKKLRYWIELTRE
jgi:predicted acetyltransferase